MIVTSIIKRNLTIVEFKYIESPLYSIVVCNSFGERKDGINLVGLDFYDDERTVFID